MTTLDQALETYKRTVKEEPRENWATWVVAVHNSLVAGSWIGNGYPDYAKQVFETIQAEAKISFSDSI